MRPKRKSFGKIASTPSYKHINHGLGEVGTNQELSWVNEILSTPDEGGNVFRQNLVGRRFEVKVFVFY